MSLEIEPAGQQISVSSFLLLGGINNLNSKMAQNIQAIATNTAVQSKLLAGIMGFAAMITRLTAEVGNIPTLMKEGFIGAIEKAVKRTREEVTALLNPVGNIVEGLGKKQTEKGAKAMTTMMASTAKASVYAWIMEQFMEVFSSFMFALTPFLPFITILAAIIKTAVTPAVIELTKVFKPAYEGMIIWMKMVKGFGKATDEATTAGERMNIILGMFGTSLEEIGEWWAETGSIAMNSWIGVLDTLGESLESLTISTNSYNNSLSLGGDSRGGGDRGGSSNPVQEFLESLIPGAAGGMYTGSYQGLVNVHPDEYIVPGNEMRSGGSGMYMQQLYTNELLTVIVRQNKRTERRTRFRI